MRLILQTLLMMSLTFSGFIQSNEVKPHDCQIMSHSTMHSEEAMHQHSMSAHHGEYEMSDITCCDAQCSCPSTGCNTTPFIDFTTLHVFSTNSSEQFLSLSDINLPGTPQHPYRPPILAKYTQATSKCTFQGC